MPQNEDNERLLSVKGAGYVTHLEIFPVEELPAVDVQEDGGEDE